MISQTVRDIQRHLESESPENFGEMIQTQIENLPESERHRVRSEFFGWGPLQTVLERPTVSEIIVNSPTEIWLEEAGKLEKVADSFQSQSTFKNFVLRLCEISQAHFSVENPFGNGAFDEFRIHIAGPATTHGLPSISIRRHPKDSWTFEKFLQCGWGSAKEIHCLRNLISQRRGFLVIGPTGSGKTSFLTAALSSLDSNERAVIIEDTAELKIPNGVSTKLLTRVVSSGGLPPISQEELVKQCLRMRPDRIVMGEIRGAEAKDFLLAMSTGHSGSFGSIHAKSAHEALLRLEMLVQMGAPQWSLQTVRRLIFLALEYLVLVERNPEGKRSLKGIYKISSLEDSGFTVEAVEAIVSASVAVPATC